MKFMAPSSFSCARGLALGILYGFFICPTIAHADDLDPFQMDNVQWMSFDRYKDEVRHGKIYEPAPVAKPDATASDNAHYLNGSKDAKSDERTVAAPQRPVNPPAMPGVNKGFEVQVGSTEDDIKAPVAQLTHMDSDPKLQLKPNWETAKEALHRLKNKSDEDNPLDVRMSFLPSLGMTPIPDPASPHGTEGRPAGALAAATAQKPQDPNAADYAKWSAELAAYKKHQLEAIQSDRATLTALQNAIHQLGLQKELNFMPGADSRLGQADYPPQPGGMDTPAPSLSNLSKN